jgi:translation initiation factor IF-3
VWIDLILIKSFFCFRKFSFPTYRIGGINIKQELAINEQITDKEIQVIDEKGVQLGVMSPADAIKIAEERSMDLVKVAPGLKPAVCKIMDYGKFRYEQSRKEKEAKKKQKVVDVKEIRLSSTIDTHDFEFKMRNAKKFLEDGDKVKATVKFKGRELSNTTFGASVLKKFAESLNEVGTMEREPRLEGRNMMIMINPKNG